MSRSTLTGVLLAVVVAFVVGRGQAQFPEDDKLEFDPLQAKELARARFGLQFAKLDEIARAKLAAARLEWDGHTKVVWHDRIGSLEYLVDTAQRVRDAELALAYTPSARAAAQERYWQFTRELELYYQTRYEAGSVPITDLAQARYHRLDAEYHLVKARAELQKK